MSDEEETAETATIAETVEIVENPENPEETVDAESTDVEEEEEEADEDETIIEYGEFDPHRFSSHYFLDKHTDSFKCLEQYLCSQSDLFTTISFFPPLPDPILDDYFNYIPPEEVIDKTGVEKYKQQCKDQEIVAISRVIRGLETDTLNLKYYGLTPKQMRGIAEALKVNSIVKTFILQDNWMTPESTQYITDIMRENTTLRVLNLRECRIGVEGAEILNEGIFSTNFLYELDLSFNGLGDEGMKILKPSLAGNSSIKILNLSHNELTEESGDTIGGIFRDNSCLEDVDLSWNGFFTGPGNMKLFKPLLTNESLKRLNMAWSGIGTMVAIQPLCRYLRKTKTLEYLDLDYNRICMETFMFLRGALINNKSLEAVRVGNNLYNAEEAYSLAMILTRPGHRLQAMDMENMCVEKDFIPLALRIQSSGKIITFGKVISNYLIKGPNIYELLFNRCRFLAMKPKKKKAKRDFGHFVLSLPDKLMTKEEFFTEIKKKKVKKLDKDLLKELMARFGTKGGKVKGEMMKEEYLKLWPDTVLPPPPEPKKKKEKKQKKDKKGKKGKNAPVVEEVKVEGAPAEGVPAEGAPAEGAPAEGAPAEGSPAEGAPAEEAPADGAPVGEEVKPDVET